MGLMLLVSIKPTLGKSSGSTHCPGETVAWSVRRLLGSLGGGGGGVLLSLELWVQGDCSRGLAVIRGMDSPVTGKL